MVVQKPQQPSAIMLARFAQQPTNGSLDQVVVVVRQLLGDPERVVQVA
jgi:hypothetical protein